MAPSVTVTIDGNEAAARIAHLTNEVIAIYPITPASPMGEWSDEWSSHGQTNLWGAVPRVIEMQSEAGAAMRRPLVRPLAHGRGRRDRVDGNDFVGQMRDTR
ncbi:MAG: hypothetical protein AAFY29_23695, partial [Pseudomonadota bacterium]